MKQLRCPNCGHEFGYDNGVVKVVISRARERDIHYMV